MPRRSLALTAFLLAVGPALAQAPKPTLYFPTTVGTKWVYQSANGKQTETRRITAVTEKDGDTIVTVSIKDDMQKFKVSAEGVFQVAWGKTKYDPPERRLQLPHKDGTKWEQLDSSWGSGRFQAFGPEKVTVPAGNYDAIRVESTITSANIGMFRNEWYAPGVGLVKYAAPIQAAIVPGDEWVLKSFVEGKKK